MAALGCLAGAAVAQPDRPRREPAFDTEQGADTRAEAQRVFSHAQQLYDAGKTEAALEAFRSSYAAFPSPNSRLYLGRCLRDLGRNAEAYAEYKAALIEAAEADDAERYSMTLEAASLERAALRPKLGMLRLALPADVPGIEVKVAGRSVDRADWTQPIPVDPGTVTVSATAPNRQPFTERVALAAGQHRTVALSLAPLDIPFAPPEHRATPPAPPPTVAPWPTWRAVAVGSAGVGAIGFAVWGAFGLQASTRYHRLQRECGGQCGPEFHDSINAGRTETLISQVGLGMGIAGVVLSGLGFWLDARSTKAMPAVELGRDRALLSWGGRF